MKTKYEIMENSKNTNKKKKLTRQDLFKTPEFWEEYIKTELFNMVQDYMDKNNMNRTELAEKLGVSKGYISQILNGNSDHRISKLVSLATQLGKAPYLYLKDLDSVIEMDENGESVYLDFEEMERKDEKVKKSQPKYTVS